MTRVCMLVHQDYYYDARVIRYAEALAKEGCEVDILALRGVKPPGRSLPPGLRVYTIPLRRAYQQRRSYMAEYAIACVLFTLWLLPLFLRRRHRVIHVHNMPDFLIFTALLPRLLGARLILDIHDLMPEVYVSKYGSTAHSRTIRLIKLQEQYAVRFAHAVITANSRFRTTLIGRGVPAEKILVVNNVADTQLFDRGRYQHAPPEGEFVLLYPGTIAPRYGLEVALRALPALIPHIPQLRLQILGAHTSHVDELVQLAKELRVSEWVVFREAIPLQDVPHVMSQAHIGIYPGFCDEHMAIATPSKVLEYAAMGLPIVSSSLPVLTDFFSPQAVRYFEPGNVTQFAQAILELYEHPIRRAELVRAADQEYVSRYTWASECGRYLGLVRRLCEKA